jgi:hypothetical protein
VVQLSKNNWLLSINPFIISLGTISKPPPIQTFKNQFSNLNLYSNII